MVNSIEQYNGVIVERHRNGNIYSVFETDSDGLYHGVLFNWYENGHKRSKITYVHGKMQGPATYWDADGLLRETSIYVNGLLNGLNTEWLANGEVKIIRYWHRGENISGQIQTIVRDITNISDIEKTQIAVQYGVIL